MAANSFMISFMYIADADSPATCIHSNGVRDVALNRACMPGMSKRKILDGIRIKESRPSDLDGRLIVVPAGHDPATP